MAAQATSRQGRNGFWGFRAFFGISGRLVAAAALLAGALGSGGALAGSDALSPRLANDLVSQPLPLAQMTRLPGGETLPGLTLDLVTPELRYAPDEAIPVSLVADVQNEWGVVRFTVEADGVLAGNATGAIERRVTSERRVSVELSLSPAGPGWGSLSVVAEQVGDDGRVLGRFPRELYVLVEAGDAWVNTTSVPSLRIDRLLTLAGERGVTVDGLAGLDIGGETLQAISTTTVATDDTPLPDGALSRDAYPEHAKILQEGFARLAPQTPQPPAGEKDDFDGVAATITVNGRVQWTDGAGGTHGLPMATVQILDDDSPFSPELITTTTTDGNGNYTVTFTHDDGLLQGDPDIFVRVLADSAAAFVRPDSASGATYQAESTVSEEVPTGSTVTKNFTTSGTGNINSAFSILHAMVVAGTYAGNLAGTMPSKIDTRYPSSTGGSFFRPSNPSIHIRNTARFSWDVIHHEYAHYFQSVHSLTNSPGGPHGFGDNLAQRLGNKGKGLLLAYSEGHASFVGFTAQIQTGAGALGIPTVGNFSYEAPALGLNVNFETRNGVGEDNELSVGAALVDLFDGNQDGDDQVTFPDKTLFDTFKAASADTVGLAWDSLASPRSNLERTLIGAALGQSNIAPVPFSPADGTSAGATPPTFRWFRNGGGTPNPLNDWEITFYNSDLTTEILSVDTQARFTNGATVTTFTPTAAEWDTIKAGDSVIKWVVKGRNTSTPASPKCHTDRTGGSPTCPGTLERYWSKAMTLNGIDIAFVIDDTGSMGGEIAGVRNGLQAFIDGLDPAADPPTIQLITFKDSVTTRITSNDLAAVRAAVAALRASGGGDCPEFGAQALALAAQNISGGGTVLFATDASTQPGVNLADVIARLRAKGVTVNTILSGDCVGGTLSIAGGEELPLAGPQGETPVADGALGEPGGPTPQPEIPPIADDGQDPLDDHGDTSDVATRLLLDALPTGGRIGFRNSDGTVSDGTDFFVVSLEAGKTYSALGEITDGTSSITMAVLGPDGSTFLGTTFISASRPRSVTFTPDADGDHFVRVTRFTSTTSPTTGYSVRVQSPGGFADLESSAVRLFSTISGLTGGAFVVNTAGSGTSYEATVRNVTESAVGASVISASPEDLPRGATLTVNLNGGKTNWRAGSAVSFEGTGITVNSTTVNSPTSISVNVTVATDAATGFRDVTVTTPLGDGTETAIGRDVNEVLFASGSATLTGIAPATLGIGETADITFNGLNTAWDSTTGVIFTTSTFSTTPDPNVTVNSVTINSPTELVANVTISPSASIGFRVARVDTPALGGATGGVDGPLVETLSRALLVDSGSSIVLPAVASVTPSTAKSGDVLDVTVVGTNTNFAAGATAANFGDGVTINSVSVTDATNATVNVEVVTGATAGFRNVTMTTGGESATLLNGFFVDLSEIRITAGPTSATNPVDSGAATALSVAATGPAGATLAFAWSANCGALGNNGSFSDAAAQNPTWTAPTNNTGDPLVCPISVEITDGGANRAVGSVDQTVNTIPHTISITGTPGGDTDPLFSGGQSVFSATVDSNWTKTVDYMWTAACPGGGGSFNSATAAGPVFTAPTLPNGSPVDCAIDVNVSSVGGTSADGSFTQTVSPLPGTTSNVFANVLPSSRSGVVGDPATAFASMVNGGATIAANCTIVPADRTDGLDDSFEFTFQPTDPTTNVAVGAQGQPKSVAVGGSQTFVIGLRPTAFFDPTDIEFVFDCANTDPAPSVIGLNSLLFSASAITVPDVIAIVATLSGDGIAVVPGPSGTGFYTVAGINIGPTSTLTVRPVANAGVPVDLTICETTGDPAGACLAPAGASVDSAFTTDVIKTFTVFVAGTGTPIPVDLAASRVTTRFEEADGTVRGATSVAVQTGPAP